MIVWLLLGARSDAYQLAARPPLLVRTPLTVRPAARLPSMCDATAVPPADEPALGFGARVKKLFSFDKEALRRSGVDAVFTYGVVSNINVGFSVALAWGTFSKSSGLSPLVPGQWKPGWERLGSAQQPGWAPRGNTVAPRRGGPGAATPELQADGKGERGSVPPAIRSSAATAHSATAAA